MIRNTPCAILAILTLMLPFPVLAAALDRASGATDLSDAANEGDPAQGGWIVTLGASGELGPKFPGAAHYGVSVMPFFDIRRFGEPAENSAADDNIDYGLFDVAGIEIGPVLGFRDSRSTSDDSRLKGLRALNWGVDGGLFAQGWPIADRLRVRSEVRQALNNDTGLVVALGADWFQPLNDRWLLSAGPRASFGNRLYMRKYFGVTDAESTANGVLPSYQAEGGLQSVGFVVSASYAVTPDMTVQFYNRFDRLTGDAADSPITSSLGSRNQNVFGIAISKAFTVRF